MALSRKRISYLLEVYSNRKASREEMNELFEWVKKGREKPLKKHIKKLVSEYHLNEMSPVVEWDKMYERILQEKDALDVQSKLHKISWVHWAAAAVVLVLLGSSYYYFTRHNEPQKVVISQSEKTNDIAPPNTVNAVLTLSNGQKIILDSTGNGLVATQGTVSVVKLANGEIAYKGNSENIEYNTLSNPRGSKVISLILADGTKVWLNAASTLKYPTAFVGNERKVEITGEAYFEVAHLPSAGGGREEAMPFIVSKGKTDVRVLGTHFNVNAYDDEKSLEVTLLEGSVRVRDRNSHRSQVIMPGEQARIKKNGEMDIAKSVDIREVMAWKNGLFSFKGRNIYDIMREVSRWYDVDVVFKKEISEKFYVEVSRNTSVLSLLKMLEATKAVQFEIKDNTITVNL